LSDPGPDRVVLLFVSPVDVPAGLPTPCALLDAAPTFVPVVPCIPVVGELVAEPVGAPAAVLFGGGAARWRRRLRECGSGDCDRYGKCN